MPARCVQCGVASVRSGRSSMSPSDFKLQTSKLHTFPRKLCKTKPNLGGLGYVGKGRCRLGGGSAGDKMRKTNPISPGRRVSVQNKTKSRPSGQGVGRGRPTYEEPKRAKRTQLGPLQAVDGGQMRKTKPIWLGCGRAPEAKCAKRTQIRRVGRWVESPLFHYSIIPLFQSDAGRAKRTQLGPAAGAPLLGLTVGFLGSLLRVD
jgi:hypothetical protein